MALKNRKCPNWKVKVLFLSILELLLNFQNFILVHCYMEGNKCVEKMANMAIGQYSRAKYYMYHPLELISSLWADVSGISQWCHFSMMNAC
uniref:RNase H type-1 domain-containing protein n=1 Tax=Nelumbo nucifera TaxID=4432 RepID=A0A822YM46_NELNU|nr:TPA_asm: hypothetical protein HUJ06_010926 [Nelumbo nucifera]